MKNDSKSAGSTASAARTDADLIAAALCQESAAPAAAAAALRLPERIGPYRIVRQIGTGGMGVVYEAEQEQPIRRRVALKVIKLGMDTREVVRRFETERQALALMDHSNIARVYDAGATEAGRPYFAMEYVPGLRITEYCDQFGLTVPERLDLFVQVCHAVQHAHQKGIIHRDLKPSNVLVTEQEGGASASGRYLVPKVIDFGVAKAVDPQGTTGTLVTEQGRLVGTPVYMSPEQAGLGMPDIDTRTDIYSLGVLLYELLVGALPYGPTYLRNRGLVEIQRIIREEEPPRPSTRLISLGHEAADCAENRRTNPGTLRRQLRGDLDWITMKALEKDRTRRYGTASDLAADIQRHLKHEPVTAGPPSAAYRVRKFVRRNRGLVAGVAVVLVVLVAGVVASTILAVGQTRAKHAALQKAYFANIAAARAALALSDPRGLRRDLDAAPLELRNWEWRYLEAESDTSLATLRGHQQDVWCMAFSPDGKRLASAGQDKSIRIWDVSTSQELRKLDGHDDIVYSVAFSPDGQRLASGSNDKTVRIWDAGSGAELLSLQGHRTEVLTVAFQSEGRVASSANDGTIRLWDLTGRQEPIVLASPWGRVFALTFSPDGRHLASACGDKVVRILDVSTGETLRTLVGHTGIVRSVAFSPDGATLASASFDQTVRIWDAATGRELDVLRGHVGRLQSVAFSPDGQRLASASDDQTVRIWDVQTGGELAVFLGHGGFVRSVAFSADGARLASASKDETIRVWDAKAPDRRGVLFLAAHGGWPVAFNRDWTLVASPGADNMVRIWDAHTGTPAWVLRGHDERVTRVQFALDGTHLVSASLDKTVRIWETSSGQEVATLRGHEAEVCSVALSPDGSRIASASGDTTVRLWDTSTHAELQVLRGHEKLVCCVSFSADGRRLASASVDATVRIWDAATGAALAVLPHGLAVDSAVFSPDGTLVASGSGAEVKDGFVHIWNTSTRQELLRLGGHWGGVNSVAFSPDGTRLASGGWDTTVRIWDVATGEELLVLRGHEHPVTSVAFSADGALLASSARDEPLVRLWDTVPYRLRYAQQQAAPAGRQTDADGPDSSPE